LLKAIRSIFIDSDNQQLQAAAPTASEERAPEDLDQTPEIPEPVEVEADKPPADLKQSINFSDYLMTMDHQSSRISALRLAMKLWDTPIEFKPYLNNLDDDQSFFRLTAKPSGLIIQRIEADLDMLMRLNLPAILEVWPPGSSEPGYLTLSKINGDTLTFGETGGENLIETDANEINFYWSGVAYVPWKNFLAIWGTIPVHSNGDSVITLKMLLNDLGFSNIDMNENYDDWTRKAVEEIQAKYGIPVDGFVGPLTKIILYRENNSFDMPYLTN
jgi:general secretion pathway protein A